MKASRDISLLYGTRLRWMSGYKGATTFSLMTASILAFGIMTQNSIMTLSIMTFRMMTDNTIITLSIMTHTLSLMTNALSKMTNKNHNDTHIMLAL